MPSLSHLAESIPQGVIRGLETFSNQAKERGTKVLHLNIGQPDIHSPVESIQVLKNYNQKLIPYGSSNGIPSFKSALVSYYQNKGIATNEREIIVTQGASEAIYLTLLAILDPGSEVIVPEPFYANFSIFIQMAGGVTVPVSSQEEKGYSLPPILEIEKRITPKTKAILLNNPCNPTGYVYSELEIKMAADIAKKYDLFLMVDEVYGDFIFSYKHFFSALNLGGMDDQLIVFDSSSKRFSLCGARVGNLITRNQKLLSVLSNMCQARLSPPIIGQLAAQAAYSASGDYISQVVARYHARRDAVMSALQQVQGISCSSSEGAFYLLLTLPVNDAYAFCKWLLTDFSYIGYTVMLAPANGFYQTEGKGKNKVRLAYVLKEEELIIAAECLSKGLKTYLNQRKN